MSTSHLGKVTEHHRRVHTCGSCVPVYGPRAAGGGRSPWDALDVHRNRSGPHARELPPSQAKTAMWTESEHPTCRRRSEIEAPLLPGRTFGRVCQRVQRGARERVPTTHALATSCELYTRIHLGGS